MSIRRRLALLLDPSLHEAPKEEPRVHLDLTYHPLNTIAFNMEALVKVMERLERRRRRPRLIECQHPELHPEIPQDFVQ